MIKALIFDMDNTLYELAEKYNDILIPGNKEDFFKTVKINKSEIKLLAELKNKYILFLITTGVKSWQEEKIDRFKLKPFFKKIFIDTGKGKKPYFEDILKMYKKEELAVVGDNIKSEIKDANELGITTIRILRGMKSKSVPFSSEEKPDYTIKNLKGLKKLINGQNIYKPIKIK